MKTTAQEHEERFQTYLENAVPYFEQVELNGNSPWFASSDERRALFDRRHQRPAPPEGLKPITSIESYQRKHSAERSEDRHPQAASA